MTEEVNLPHYEGGTISTKVAMPGPHKNGDDEDDGGEDEVIKAAAQLEPIFKPGRNRRAEAHKEA